MTLLRLDLYGEAAVTRWAVGWLTSFPTLAFAENDLVWMLSATISLVFMATGIAQALIGARRKRAKAARPPR